MRTEIIRRKLYKFKELSKDAKRKALEDNWDWNVRDFDWWDSCYEDAERAGLKITEFDLDYRQIKGELTMTAMESIEAILKDHGDICDTYRLAVMFKQRFQALRDEYKNELARCYIDTLQKEYDYQTSEESIVDSLEANGTEFLASGEMA